MEEKKADRVICRERRFVSHGGDIWGFSRKYNVPLDEVLEFSGPINFLGPSPKAIGSRQATGETHQVLS